MTEREYISSLVDKGISSATKALLEETKRIVAETHHFDSAVDHKHTLSELVADHLIKNGVAIKSADCDGCEKCAAYCANCNKRVNVK